MANLTTEGKTTTQSALSRTALGILSGMLVISCMTFPAFSTRSCSFSCPKAGPVTRATATTPNHTLIIVIGSPLLAFIVVDLAADVAAVSDCLRKRLHPGTLTLEQSDAQLCSGRRATVKDTSPGQTWSCRDLADVAACVRLPSQTLPPGTFTRAVGRPAALWANNQPGLKLAQRKLGFVYRGEPIDESSKDHGLFGIGSLTSMTSKTVEITSSLSASKTAAITSRASI